MGSIPGSGKILWRRKCNPLQYSCLEKSMDRGAWQVTVRGVVKSWTWLKRLSTHTCTRFRNFLVLLLKVQQRWTEQAKPHFSSQVGGGGKRGRQTRLEARWTFFIWGQGLVDLHWCMKTVHWAPLASLRFEMLSRITEIEHWCFEKQALCFNRVYDSCWANSKRKCALINTLDGNGESYPSVWIILLWRRRWAAAGRPREAPCLKTHFFCWWSVHACVCVCVCVCAHWRWTEHLKSEQAPWQLQIEAWLKSLLSPSGHLSMDEVLSTPDEDWF